MEATLIATHLLRVEHALTLGHPLTEPRSAIQPDHQEMSAMLVIPSGRGARVAVGRYVAAAVERPMRFLLAGRAEIKLHRLDPKMAAWHAA